MRHVIVCIIILLAPALAGCDKPQAAPPRGQVEVRPMESLRPIEPVGPAEPNGQQAPPARSAAVTAEVALPATRPAAGPAQPKKYTVQRKDTLWSIAVRYLGDGKRWKEIQAVNAGLEPAKLNPGQIIMLPPK